MATLDWILAFLATTVSSTPVPGTLSRLSQRAPVVSDEPHGEPWEARITFSIASKLCICTMAGLLGYRLGKLDNLSLKSFSLTQAYVYLLYFLSIGFVISAAAINSGQGLVTNSACKASIRLCLGLYASSKVTMYLFLLERAHVVRAAYMPRYRDPLWLWSTIAIAGSLVATTVAGFVEPLHGFFSDGRCHIGLQRYSSIPLLTCDILVNVYLTLVFVYLMSPLIKSSRPSGGSFGNSITHWIGSSISRARQKANVEIHRSSQVMAAKVEKLLWKTLIGCVLVILPTAGNLAALCILVGKELAFICLMVCAFDITWAACIFHWLTLAGNDEPDKLTTTQPRLSQGTQSQSQQQRPPPRPPTPTARKSSWAGMSEISLELASIDAEKGMKEEQHSGRSSPHKDYTSRRSSHKPSVHSDSSLWRDSGHSTLVVAAPPCTDIAPPP